VHAPTLTDVEQLRLVAADADAPLTTEDVAFLGSGRLVLRVDGPDRLAVIGIARTTDFSARHVRRAVAEARAVWAVIQHAARSADAMLLGGPGLRCPPR
jgi:hypothetical protein